MAAIESNSDHPRVRPRPLVDSVLSHPSGAYKWQKKYDPAIIEYIPELYEGGRTDCQVAVDIGICESTFYDWIKQYPAFASAVKYGKAISKSAMSDEGLAAIKDGKKINDKVWHIMMRNCHGYDKAVIDPKEQEEKDKQERISNRAQEIINAETD